MIASRVEEDPGVNLFSGIQLNILSEPSMCSFWK